MNVDEKLLAWGDPSTRQLPGSVAFDELLSVKLPSMESIAYARREIVKPKCPLNPQTWDYPATVVQLVGTRPAYALFFGKNDLDLTICRFFRWLPSATGQAAALERWRLFGGRLRKGNSSGIIKYFVLWHHAYPFTAQKKPFRFSIDSPYQRLHQWLETDHLEIAAAVDVRLGLHHTQVDPKSSVVVPQYQAETWGQFEFGGDVQLNLKQCLEWKYYGTGWRALNLDQEQAARYKLFTKLPRKRIEELSYHASAPCYH